MATWLGFGKPMKLVNVDLVAWVELREEDATIHLLGGEKLPVSNTEIFDLVLSLVKAGATELSSKSMRIDPPEPGRPSP